MPSMKNGTVELRTARAPAEPVPAGGTFAVEFECYNHASLVLNDPDYCGNGDNPCDAQGPTEPVGYCITCHADAGTRTNCLNLAGGIPPHVERFRVPLRAPSTPGSYEIDAWLSATNTGAQTARVPVGVDVGPGADTSGRTVQRAGEPSTMAATGGTCTTGFIGHTNGTPHLVIAHHCAPDLVPGDRVRVNNRDIGVVTHIPQELGGTKPGVARRLDGDYMVVRLDNPAIGVDRRIQGRHGFVHGEPYTPVTGDQITRVGIGSSTSIGRVNDVNTDIVSPEGLSDFGETVRLENQVHAQVNVQPGDSGGPILYETSPSAYRPVGVVHGGVPEVAMTATSLDHIANVTGLSFAGPLPQPTAPDDPPDDGNGGNGSNGEQPPDDGNGNGGSDPPDGGNGDDGFDPVPDDPTGGSDDGLGGAAILAVGGLLVFVGMGETE